MTLRGQITPAQAGWWSAIKRSSGGLQARPAIVAPRPNNTEVPHTMPRYPRPTPCRVADETFLVHDHIADGENRLSIQFNSMVIRGDATGGRRHRRSRPAETSTSISSSDSSSRPTCAGCSCPMRTSTTPGTSTRSWPHARPPRWHELVGDDAPSLAAGAVDPTRPVAPIADGDVLDIGDRVLVVERPPLYDSPATFGLVRHRDRGDLGGRLLRVGVVRARPRRVGCRRSGVAARFRRVPAVAQPVDRGHRRPLVEPRRRPARGAGRPQVDRQLPRARPEWRPRSRRRSRCCASCPSSRPAGGRSRRRSTSC